jgi:hypothetical protein
MSDLPLPHAFLTPRNPNTNARARVKTNTKCWADIACKYIIINGKKKDVKERCNKHLHSLAYRILN